MISLFSRKLTHLQCYPKSEKYISLYPPESTNPSSQLSIAKKAASETDARRTEIRAQVAAQMEAGELNGKPEDEIVHEQIRASKGAQSQKGVGLSVAQSAKPSMGGDDFFETDEEGADDNEDMASGDASGSD